MQPPKVSTTVGSGFDAGDSACLQRSAEFYNAVMSTRRPGAGLDAAEALRREIAQLEHELRRVRDGLERNRSRELERRARRLRDNIDLCKRELDSELKDRPGDG
jgi:hypothetical protein